MERNLSESFSIIGLDISQLTIFWTTRRSKGTIVSKVYVLVEFEEPVSATPGSHRCVVIDLIPLPIVID